jgi:O-antigen biosynthesis protein
VRSTINRAQIQWGRRYRQCGEVLRKEGTGGIAGRIRARAAQWLQPKEVVLPVRREDVAAADLSRPFQAVVPKVKPGERVIVNWVTTPGSPGSGGHTTMFRIIRYLEAHGYHNRVYFYDVFGGDHDYYESIVRRYYDFHGSVARVEEGMEDAHIVMATGWPTAYPIFNSRCHGKRCYFVQDFEPYFFPVGSMSLLAENTYRMGFHGISIGRCYAQKLIAEFGMTVDSFKYGCDISRYHRLPSSQRSGIVFYARRETARRGFELGMMALEVFAARRPDITIHIYGDKIGKLQFPFVDHGHVTPDELNEIYNQCYAGLSLSFTNVSLVALEMLAAGCIPVVNDTVEVRTDFDNRLVRYAPAYPQALASALEAVVDIREFDSLSQDAAASVHSTSWDDAGAAVDAILRKALESSSLIGNKHA